MKNSLQVFVSIIDVIMHGLDQKTKIDKLETVKLPIVIEREKNVIERAFQDFLLTEHEKYHLIRLTKKYHDTIVNLSDTAYAAIPETFSDDKPKITQSKAIKDLYLLIVMSLEELLQSIEVESSGYLDENLIASDYFADLHSRKLELKFLQLESQWSNLQIDSGLVNLLQTYFLSDRVPKPSYKAIVYAENLMEALLTTADLDTAGKCINHIWYQLIKFNFNMPEVLDYAKFRIAQQSQGYESPVKSHRFILLTLKNIRQVAEHASWNFLDTGMSLKTYLEVILLEELSWLEKSHPNLMDQYLATEQSRIQMNSTREEMNLFTILSIKLRKIQNDDAEEVMAILSQFVSTKGNPEESKYRFKNNFSEINLETVKRYEQHLIRSRQQLRAEYPELDDSN